MESSFSNGKTINRKEKVLKKLRWGKASLLRDYRYSVLCQGSTQCLRFQTHHHTSCRIQGLSSYIKFSLASLNIREIITCDDLQICFLFVIVFWFSYSCGMTCVCHAKFTRIGEPANLFSYGFWILSHSCIKQNY